MAMPFAHEDLTKLKNFIDFVTANPTILNLPQLEFVKNFLEKFGGRVPIGAFNMPEGSKCPFGGANSGQPESNETKSDKEPEDTSESEESDVELDMEGVISGDTGADQFMGDTEKEPTEDDMDRASELRSQAVSAYSNQNYDEAINLYTKAIELNPGNALMHAKRGQAFLKLSKPNACIRDCDMALKLNCDSAAAYKFRGRANRLLGNWEAAAKDLRQACKLDFDEETDEWLREVTPNAKKIEQHRIKLQRKRDERNRKTHEANIGAREKQKSHSDSAGTNMPDANIDPINLSEILGLMYDPEVAAALKDITKNPANIEKYKSNPKLLKHLDLIKNLSKNAPEGFMDGFSGVFPNAAGATAAGATAAGATATGATAAGAAPDDTATSKKPSFADDNLD